MSAWQEQRWILFSSFDFSVLSKFSVLKIHYFPTLEEMRICGPTKTLAKATVTINVGINVSNPNFFNTLNFQNVVGQIHLFYKCITFMIRADQQ